MIVPPRIACRLAKAAEESNLGRLAGELQLAAQFTAADEERLELLGAIASDLASGNAGVSVPRLQAHVALLRHLSQPAVWQN